MALDQLDVGVALLIKLSIIQAWLSIGLIVGCRADARCETVIGMVIAWSRWCRNACIVSRSRKASPRPNRKASNVPQDYPYTDLARTEYLD